MCIHTLYSFSRVYLHELVLTAGALNPGVNDSIFCILVINLLIKTMQASWYEPVARCSQIHPGEAYDDGNFCIHFT